MYNYYNARFWVQTARRANIEGCQCSRDYGYVVRIHPPITGEGRRSGKYVSWCKTKAIAQDEVNRQLDAQRKGYHACPCGSDKQARACCGVPFATTEGITTAEAARQYAVDWQQWQSERAMSYGEVMEWQEILQKLADKFGLEAEFKENGIL